MLRDNNLRVLLLHEKPQSSEELIIKAKIINRSVHLYMIRKRKILTTNSNEKIFLQLTKTKS